MRWGIFWRTLHFDLQLVGDIVMAAALMHNFIVDERGLMRTVSTYKPSVRLPFEMKNNVTILKMLLLLCLATMSQDLL
jgi:hypothetical protein